MERQETYYLHACFSHHSIPMARRWLSHIRGMSSIDSVVVVSAIAAVADVIIVGVLNSDLESQYDQFDGSQKVCLTFHSPHRSSLENIHCYSPPLW